jgi:hypothetical protein
MSDSHSPKPFYERYWQHFVILLGVIFVLILALYKPSVA